MAVYTYVTQAQAIAQISARLYDATNQFWSTAELALYLNEALRTWNAHTSYWRKDFTFQTVAATSFYDLTDTTAMPNTVRPYTVTDDQLYRLIQFQLLEPSVGVNPWTGVSTQFSAADLINAVARRRDEILSVAGCTINRRTTPAVAGRIQLSDRVIDVRRMAYLPNALFNQPNSVVWPDDTWAEQSFDPLFTLNPAGTPQIYRMTTEPPISFDTDRPPAYAGDYELLTIDGGPALVAATPQTLLIPDDWTPVLKYGALADLLGRESNAQDLPRAQYCEQRYRMGMTLLVNASALLAARIANVPLQIDSIRAADLYNTSWQSRPTAKPDSLYHAGLNLLALSPVPDAIYSMTMFAVQNAPLPVAPADPVEVSRDDLEVIIDLAQHIAMFKCGGAEFLNTIPLLERFIKQTVIYGAKLDEIGEYMTVLKGLSQRENQMNPRMQPDGEAAAASAPSGASNA